MKTNTINYIKASPQCIQKKLFYTFKGNSLITKFLAIALRLKTVTLIFIAMLLLACNDDETVNDNEEDRIVRQLTKTERIYNGNEATKQTNTLAYRNYSLIDDYQINASAALLNVDVSYDQNDQVQSTSVNGLQVVNYNNVNLAVQKITSNAGKSVTDFIFDNGILWKAIAKRFDDNGNEISSRTNTFTYNPDRLIRSMTYQIGSQHYAYLFYYDTTKNLTEILEKWGSTDGENFTNSNSYTITYDTKVNPSHVYLSNMKCLFNGWTFHDMPKGNGLFEEVFYQDLGNGHYIKFYGVNNVLTNETNSRIESYEYEYDTYNYPTKVIENRIDRNTNPDTRYTMQYNFFYEEI